MAAKKKTGEYYPGTAKKVRLGDFQTKPGGEIHNLRKSPEVPGADAYKKFDTNMIDANKRSRAKKALRKSRDEKVKKRPSENSRFGRKH